MPNVEKSSFHTLVCSREHSRHRSDKKLSWRETYGRARLATPEQRRRHSRFECKGIAQVYFTRSAVPCPAEILNLSVGGALVVMQQPRDTYPGENMEVAFTVNDLPFRVRAQVRSVRSDRVLGVLFSPSERVKGHLEDLVEELAANQ